MAATKDLEGPLPNLADDDDDTYLSGPLPPEEGLSLPTEAPPGQPGMRADLATTLGGIAGAQLGGPFPPARGVGAGVGAAAGHLAGRTSEDFEQGGLHQVAANLHQNLIEAAKAGLMNGSIEMAAPVVGQVAMGIPGVRTGLQKAGGAIAKTVGEWVLPKTSPATEAMGKRLAKEGSPGLTPSQRIDPTSPEESRFTKIGESLAYNAWFGGPLRKTYQVNEDAAQEAFTRFADTMTKLSPKDFEGVARQVLTGRMKQNMYEPMDKIYDNLRSRATGNIVESTGLLKDLRDPKSKIGDVVISKLRNLRESSKDTGDIDGLIKILSTPAKGTQTQAMPKLTFNQALRLKAQLNNIAEGPTSTDPTISTMMATAGRLANQVDGSIRTGLQRAQTMNNDPTLLRAYDNASKTYARLAEKYQNGFVQDVLKKIDSKPGTLAEMLLPSNIAHPEQQKQMIDAVKAAYGPRWNTEVRPLMAATLASRAFDATTGRYNGVAMAQQLKNYGSDQLDRILGPKTAEAMMNHARTLETVAQRPKNSGAFSIAINLAQASALMGLPSAATGFAIGENDEGGRKTDATILIAPWVLGHLYGNPTWLKAVDSGLLQFAKTGKAPGILTTTLRQAAATAGRPTFEAALTTEKPPSLVEAALSRRPEPSTEGGDQ